MFTLGHMDMGLLGFGRIGAGGGGSPSFAYSTESGSLTSGSSVDVSLPSGTTFVTAVVYEGVTNSTNQITARLLNSGSVKSARQLQDVSNGSTIFANADTSDLASSQTVASAAQKRGLYLQAGLVGNASYRTFFVSKGGSENETARTAMGRMATAQAEDTLRFTTPDTFSSGSYYVLIESGETAHTLSTSSGTLSGTNASISIPAGAVRAKLLIWNASMSGTGRINVQIRESSTAKNFKFLSDSDNGTLIDFRNASAIGQTPSTAAGVKHGVLMNLRGLGDASVQTVGWANAFCESETGQERAGFAETAQLEDEIYISTASTFAGGSYYAIFEGA